MNIGQILLFSHLIGATLVGVLIITAFVCLLKNISQRYKFLAKSIAIGTAAQLLTGSLLALTALQREPLLYFCSKVGIYVTVVLVVEGLLYRQMNKENLRYFPLKFVTSSLTFGIFFVIITMSIYNNE
ncbi:MAG TPA: hypothetical protein VK338_02835 [Candidatus Nitrosocosmicus sp.]|nr:hypothetical protein [Candidatus Nitrosocosmicus sp.]